MKRKIRDRVDSAPTGPIRDVHLTIKLRNNQLMERRLASGLTQIELAQAAGIPHAILSALETMRTQPTREIKDRHCRAPTCGKKTFAYAPFCGAHEHAPEDDRKRWLAEYEPVEVTAWTVYAEKLAAFFCVSPDVLFPEALRAIRKTTIVSALNVPQLLAVAGLASGEPSSAQMVDGIEAREVSAALSDALATLRPRSAEILRRRYGLDDGGDGQTQDVIGVDFDICGARVQSLEAEALRKLRDSKVLRKATGR